MQLTLESPSALTSVQANRLNNITDFDQNIALTLLKLDSEFPVNFDLAWQWLEFTTKGNGKSSLIECGFEEGEDFRIIMENHNNSNIHSKTSSRGRKIEKIWLTIDCFKSWAMMCRNNKGKQIRKYFLQCERNLKQAIEQNAVIAAHVQPKSLFDLSESQKIGRAHV